MAFGVNVSADLSQVEKYFNDVRRNRIPKAIGSALKRTADAVRTDVDKQLRQRFALSSAVVKKNLIARRVNNRLAAEVIASGSPIPLRDYQARQTKKGATYRVKRAGGRKRYQREGRAGFIMSKYGGHVFVRTEDDPPGKAKGKIKKVYGPSIPQYFLSRFMRDRMDDVARETFTKRFEQELRYQFEIRK